MPVRSSSTCRPPPNLDARTLDPDYPPAGEQGHLDQGAHERAGSFSHGSTVGLFRHEDESFKPYFLDFACLYPGRYKLRASFWSFQWDKGKILPSVAGGGGGG